MKYQYSEELPNLSSKISEASNLFMTLLSTVDLCSVLGIRWVTACTVLNLSITYAFLDRSTGNVFDVVASSIRLNIGATYTKILGQ